MKLSDLDYNALKLCINLYLDNAFPNGVPETSFNYQLIERVKNAQDFDELFSIFKKEEPEEGKLKYSLQLGSYKYPYVKVVLQRCDDDEFGFLVDRHTEYMKAKTQSDYFEKELVIKNYTKDLKLKVENLWEQNDISTFREIVREQTEQETKKKSNMQIDKLGYSILLVEDDLDIGKLHKLKMELLGYDVTLAINGEDALTLLDKKNYDLMVLDLMMPTISGFEVIKRVADKIPIVVLSAISDKMTMQNCIKDGAVAFMIKPVTAEMLKEVLDKVIDKLNK